ncbi:phage tail assembly chaperone [Deefgea piscis]|uniref:phage tail assembly chaperone n=1 Tax=Deefgea piscis TaxID=2739061 RepID=UPI001C7E2A15|nr:phage tail assembly chaperone [Deefgea piscis]QZA80183.1 phage tail assembly chaperone [Deefgea piscis]
MFKLQPKPTFKAKIALSIPGQDKQVEVTIEFKHLPRPQVKEFFDQLEGKKDHEALSEIVVGWDGIDAPFDHAALETLCVNYPTAGSELFAGFRKSFLESRTKN